MAAFVVTVEGLVGRGIDVIFVLVLVWVCCGMNEVVVFLWACVSRGCVFSAGVGGSRYGCGCGLIKCLRSFFLSGF